MSVQVPTYGNGDDLLLCEEQWRSLLDRMRFYQADLDEQDKASSDSTNEVMQELASLDTKIAALETLYRELDDKRAGLLRTQATNGHIERLQGLMAEYEELQAQQSEQADRRQEMLQENQDLRVQLVAVYESMKHESQQYEDAVQTLSEKLSLLAEQLKAGEEQFQAAEADLESIEAELHGIEQEHTSTCRRREAHTVQYISRLEGLTITDELQARKSEMDAVTKQTKDLERQKKRLETAHRVQLRTLVSQQERSRRIMHDLESTQAKVQRLTDLESSMQTEVSKLAIRLQQHTHMQQQEQ